MKLPPNHIQVSVDLLQQRTTIIGGMKLLMGNLYNQNHRESNPVICRVEKGLPGFKKGDWLICHYNMFDEDSPKLLYELDGLHHFAVELSDGIICKVSQDGNLEPVCGNVLANRIRKAGIVGLLMPDEVDEFYHDRVEVDSDVMDLRKGDTAFTEKYADYEICYMLNGEPQRKVKILYTDIVGVLEHA